MIRSLTHPQIIVIIKAHGEKLLDYLGNNRYYGKVYRFGEKDVLITSEWYAVSIHKSQGLEYDSVKVIISEDVDERITHSIFYTAITRARKSLKIYMTEETQSVLAQNFINSNVGLKQAQIFAGHSGLKLKNKLKS